MRFWVSVPVLSEQITWTDPRVSTAGSRRMSARRFSMRCAPRESAIVTTAVSASGMAATARLTDTSSISRQASPRSTPSAKTTITSTEAAAASCRPSWSSRFCSGVCSCSTDWSRSATVPSSVAMPVAVTIPSPWP